ncbi:hypothetical protein BGZ61DRAFT_353538 [Ilyonectria robusta]|uniref:uncharacterized protein n=1 Tax=Ilyonectria robusta TaxID=1079257 RepID=UPI001E8E3C54|nr:uncharacterized protein BGZ61DRAFT_353538 [Ilyonectria robusta]KAH8688273.1 hypothetical protein BGZ61DRAFT_353538 [Ilyonectria robusta]
MKVIVTGATGLVGKEIVRQCLADPRITKLVILTRRAVSMDVESHPKTDIVMHQDFSKYSEDLMRRLAGASACLWAIGGRAYQDDNDKELLHKVTVEFPLAAAKAMSDSIAAAAPPGSKFSFVFCSTKSADRHPSKTLLFLSDARRQRGEAEKGLCEIADANPDAFATWILRPSGIATGDAPKKRRLVGSRSSAGIEPPQLAKAVIKVACEGWKDRVVDNDALLKM